MICELDKRDFSSIEPLLTPGIRFPEILSVIEGNNRGRVFADKSDRPTAALVWSKGIEGFYLVGDENNTQFLAELNAYIDEIITPRMQKLKLDWFEICGNREAWNPVIEAVFEERKFSRSFQCIYKLDSKLRKPAIESPLVGCQVKRVDRSLLVEGRLRNSEFLLSKIIRFWESGEVFLDKGLGYAVVCGEEVVSTCFSAFVTGSTHAIDVETTDEYRRRGFGKVAAREFIEDCLQRSLKPHWECMQDNIASVALAEKLGLKKSLQYKLYSFPVEKPKAT